MPVTYFKRFRMEISLVGRDFASGALLPDGYRLHGWDEALLQYHAGAKFRSFAGQVDAEVFPCLGESDGCHRLMGEISRKDGFMPEATWLLSWQAAAGEPIDFCGTVQGIRDRSGYGAVQNLGIAPEHRRLGLGSYLLNRALTAFQRYGLRRAYLEVTAQNAAAIQMYQRMGFIRIKTVYKAVEMEHSVASV